MTQKQLQESMPLLGKQMCLGKHSDHDPACCTGQV